MENKTKIKMCGMMRVQDIEAANEIHPDYIGFIFVEGRRRYVTYEKAGEMKKLLDPDIKAVGVFINEEIDKVTKLVKDGIVDIVQLHGEEGEDYIQELKAKVDCPVIKCFQLPRDSLLDVVLTSADMVLIDSGTGTGKTFDWQLIEGVTRPYFLAGGIDETNIEEAIEKLHPYAIDVSSGIETDGLKDPEKMKKLKSIVSK
ncbi:MAG: phosphoribosylanthranilate isomerase [Eubacterium sp.]|nr:phosphoribosylanthranilate isomerase [Eubacterium sp.]